MRISVNPILLCAVRGAQVYPRDGRPAAVSNAGHDTNGKDDVFLFEYNGTAIVRLQRQLEQDTYPRIQMGLIVALTGAAGWVVSVLLLYLRQQLGELMNSFKQWVENGSPDHLLPLPQAYPWLLRIYQCDRHGTQLTVPAGEALLDVLEAAGIEVMHDCRRGECGLCAMDVLALDGHIDHRDVFLSDAEKSGNRRICACVSRVVGRITLDTAWRPETVA